MNAKIEVAMVTLTALFVFGCERTENVKEAVPIHAGNVETVSASKDDVTAATLARITSASVTLTNYLYCESDKVMGLCQRIGSDISTLPPEIGQQCVKEIVRSVVAIPYERLEYGARYRALDKMWHITRHIGLSGMRKVDLWELIILRLSRIRDTIEHTRSETDSWDKKRFIAGQTEFLDFYSEECERDLAYKSSPQADPCTSQCLLGKMSEEEYAIIKAKFEAFLGRPIRTYEEITRLQIERIQQQKLEEERRRGDPDVQVDTDGL